MGSVGRLNFFIPRSTRPADKYRGRVGRSYQESDRALYTLGHFGAAFLTGACQKRNADRAQEGENYCPRGKGNPVVLQKLGERYSTGGLLEQVPSNLVEQSSQQSYLKVVRNT